MRELLLNDNRNVVDYYKYWSDFAIKKDLSDKAHDFSVAMMHVRGDMNIGTLVRNCNAFVAKKIYYIGKRQWDRRGAVGTHHYVDMNYLPTFDDLLKAHEGPIVSIDNVPEAQNIMDFEWPDNVLMLFGEETHGIDPSVVKRTSACVYIPQYGSVRSLNVGCASSIAMYSWCLQKGQQ